MRGTEFTYMTASGKRGIMKARMKPVATAQPAHILAFKFEHLTANDDSAVIVQPCPGITITAARMLESGGELFAPFKYGLIYEREQPECYAVFYLTASGDVLWVAGPKSVSFDKAWGEFSEALRKAAD